MSGTPSKNGGNGRDAKTGQFLPGNSGGPGNRRGIELYKWRAVLLEATSPEDVLEIWKVGMQRAKDGDIHWAREIFNRLMGKPKETVEVDLNLTISDFFRRLAEAQVLEHV